MTTICDKNMSQQCAITAEKTNSIHGKQVEGSMYSPQFREVYSFGLHNRKHEQTGENPAEKDTKIIRRLEHWHIRSWKSCLFSLKKTEQDLIKVSSTTSFGAEKSETHIRFAQQREEGDRYKLQQGKLWFVIRDNNKSQEGQWSTGKDWQERLWNLHDWRYLKLDCTISWANWSNLKISSQLWSFPISEKVVESEDS